MKPIATGFCCVALAIIPVAAQAAQLSSTLRTPNMTTFHPPMNLGHPISSLHPTGGMNANGKNTNGNKPSGSKHIKFQYGTDESQMDTYVGK